MPAAFGPRDLNKAIKKENEGYQNDFSKKQVDTSKPWKSADPVRYNNLKDAPKIGSAAQKQTWKDGKVVPYNNNPNGPKIGVKPPGPHVGGEPVKNPNDGYQNDPKFLRPKGGKKGGFGPGDLKKATKNYNN